MYYIGLDVHKKTISYCVKDASGQVHREGTIGATRNELDWWMKTLPEPRIMAMEATIFTGWIYDHLLPHAERVKVAHPLMLREQRRCYRHRVDADVLLQLGSGPEARAQVVNLSEGGMRLEAAERLRGAGEVRFRFKLPESGIWLEGRAHGSVRPGGGARPSLPLWESPPIWSST